MHIKLIAGRIIYIQSWGGDEYRRLCGNGGDKGSQTDSQNTHVCSRTFVLTETIRIYKHPQSTLIVYG